MTNQPCPNQIAGGMLMEFEHEAALTRKVLERIPHDKLDWKPHPKSMSMGELALHIASLTKGVLHLSLQDIAEVPDFSGGPEKPADHAAILQRLDEAVAYVKKTLPTLDDNRMFAPQQMTKAGQVVMEMPRLVFLRAIMLNHWFQHRGQLLVYLRLTGATVPATYGPSGDEAM